MAPSEFDPIKHLYNLACEISLCFYEQKKKKKKELKGRKEQRRREKGRQGEGGKKGGLTKDSI